MRNIISVVKQDALFSDFSYKNMGIHGWGNSRWMEYVSTFEVLEGLLCSNKKKKNPEFSTNVSHCLTLNVFILLT